MRNRSTLIALLLSVALLVILFIVCGSIFRSPQLIHQGICTNVDYRPGGFFSTSFTLLTFDDGMKMTLTAIHQLPALPRKIYIYKRLHGYEVEVHSDR